MDSTTVVREQIDFGEKLIEHLLREGFDVSAAFWLKESERNRWDFYIVSTVRDQDHGGSYGQLLPLMRQMPRPYWIDPQEVRLLGTSDQLAKDVLKIYERSARTGVHPQLWDGSVLGRRGIDAKYFYFIPGTKEPQAAGASGG